MATKESDRNRSVFFPRTRFDRDSRALVKYMTVKAKRHLRLWMIVVGLWLSLRPSAASVASAAPLGLRSLNDDMDGQQRGRRQKGLPGLAEWSRVQRMKMSLRESKH
ncbi:hypothetical protein NL676_020312 [Syzygium grande]|nr:hypothetical protein NL676_020312 [Syzygium grande]